MIKFSCSIVFVLIFISVAVVNLAFGKPVDSGQVQTPQGLHLIELAPGHRVWMTDEQVYQLALQKHKTIGGFRDVTHDTNFTPVPVHTLGDLGRLEPKQQAIVAPMLQNVSATSLMAADKVLESMGLRSYKTEQGVKAAEWIHDMFIKLAHGRTDVTVGYFKHSFLQPSVFAEIKGQGPQSGERVILGAHEDSIVGPGADDDGSGVVTVLEAFRILMASNYHPNRTLTFFTYAGEEGACLEVMTSRPSSDKKIFLWREFFTLT